MEDFYCVHVDRSMKSMNFQYKATLPVNGCTHLTHYISNIETTNTLLDVQFCRYNQTLMKVTSIKYEVATSIITIFMLENVYMHQIVLTTTIDTMLFSVSFTEILMSYVSSVRSWTPETGTPTDPTGSPKHRKNHLDEDQAGSGTATHQEDICVN